jgi:hypothetical protein
MLHAVSDLLFGFVLGLEWLTVVLGSPDVGAGNTADVAHCVDQGDGGGFLGGRAWDGVRDPGQHDESRCETSYSKSAPLPSMARGLRTYWSSGTWQSSEDLCSW